MNARKGRWAVGLISGTSMDGVDAALVKMNGSRDRPSVKLRAFCTLPYPRALRQALVRVAGGEQTTTGEISRLNFLVGEQFAAAALAACRHGRVAPSRLAVIGSHGQTIFHQGRQRFRHQAGTLQIGEPAVIAETTGVPVVADFRTADVAAGGEGAPLVPMLDYLLLRDTKRGVVALNLGGIANVTVLKCNAGLADVFGFDTGPGNMVIDSLVRHSTHGRKGYDTQGHWASRGAVAKDILARALAFPFFNQLPPKSAGREQFGEEFLKRYFLGRRIAAEDLLCTATELTAQSVTDALRRFVFPRISVHRLIISGGGAHNHFLISRISRLLPELDVLISDRFGLPVDAKEAMAFALLADRTLHGVPGNLPSVTGARHPVILGKILKRGKRS